MMVLGNNLPLLFCSYLLFRVIFIFVYTSVALLPPGENPIAVNNNNKKLKLLFIVRMSYRIVLEDVILQRFK
jgi:hypothetical protein